MAVESSMYSSVEIVAKSSITDSKKIQAMRGLGIAQCVIRAPFENRIV